MAMMTTDFTIEEIMEECRSEGALYVLSHFKNYVDEHIDRFSHGTLHPEVRGAIRMLAVIKEFISAATELYVHPELEQQTIQKAKQRQLDRNKRRQSMA